MKLKSKSKQITITINSEILKKVDDFAHNNGISRSSLITTALVEYMQQKDGVNNAIKEFLENFITKNNFENILKTEGGKND